MLNKHVPFPRYENAIFFGDKATDTLSALKIYAKCQIGGEIPSIELLHPQTKLLECTVCAMRDRQHIIDKTLNKINADYILLEDNGLKDLNPAHIKDELEAQGFTVKILDVTGGAIDVLTRAGALFDEEKIAKRVIRDYQTRFENLSLKNIKKEHNVLILLGMRRPVTQETFIFAVSQNSELSNSLKNHFFTKNVLLDSAELIEATDLKLLLEKSPDLIALCGDATCVMTAINQVIHNDEKLKQIPAIKNYQIIPLPYYCDAMAWREPQILTIWAEALEQLR